MQVSGGSRRCDCGKLRKCAVSDVYSRELEEASTLSVKNCKSIGLFTDGDVISRRNVFCLYFI